MIGQRQSSSGGGSGGPRMSRFGMGFGKDNPKDIKGYRPAVRINSARVQAKKNEWFTDEESGGRPEWFQTVHKPEKRVGGPDLGEWKIVWHPRSRMNSPTLPARKVMMTLKDDEEKERLKRMLADGLSKSKRGGDLTTHSEPMLPMADTDELRSMSRGSRRLGKGEERAPSRGSDRPLSRASTVASGRSRRSYGTGMSSTVTTNAKELLDRIHGLEFALKQEQTLRKKMMQSVISLESWAESPAE